MRQVSQSDAGLVVNVSSPGAPLDHAALATLAAAAPQIVDLNLQDAALDDDGLAAIGELTAARRLRLSGNRITDRGLPALARLKRLESLNLYGNAGVTDAAVEALARMPALTRGVSVANGSHAGGAAKLRAARPGLTVQLDAGEAFTAQSKELAASRSH